jgi:catechol 2,3-dioxygenase-like lactoylglutathione lyase family enzyme
MPAAKSSHSSKPSPIYFASVAVVVSDREKATDWYTKTLGLDLLVDSDHWVTVGRKGKGGALHLCQASDSGPEGRLEPGNSGICIRVPGKDFVAACAALKARGVRFAQEPKKEEWGWGATIADPDGNEIYLSPDA